MRKLIATLILIGLSNAYPILSFNGEWLGTGGYFGPYAAFNAPQNLASKYNPSFVLILPHLHTGFNNNLFSLNLYNELAPMDTITPQFKQKILDKLEDGFQINSYLAVSPFGLSIGPVGISSKMVGAFRVQIPTDLFRIGLYGLQVGKTYDFSSLNSEAIAYQQNTLGFGIREKIGGKKVHFGLSGSYIVGLGYTKLSSRTGRITVTDTSITVKDTVEFQYSTPNFVYNLNSFNLSDLKPAGVGFTFTLGSSVEITPKFILGLTLENLISSINWNSDSTFRGLAAITSNDFNLFDLFEADSLRQIFSDTIERTQASFKTRLPLILRISGMYDFYRFPAKLYFDLEQGFSNTALSSTKPKLSLAMALHTFIPIYIGSTIGGGQKPVLSFGTGLELPFLFVNIGISNQGGFIASAEGLSATVTAGFRTPITQSIEGTIYDSTTLEPLIAKVEIVDARGKSKIISTDKSGKFKIKVPWGYTKITVRAKDYTSKETKIFVDKKEKVKTVLYLQPLVGDLIVLVTDGATGLPKEYVSVILEDEEGKTDTLLTDETGRIYKKFREGSYTIRIQDANYKPIYETINIKALETLTKNYALVSIVGEAVGKVFDAKTNKSLVAKVAVYDMEGNLLDSLNTDIKGEFYVKLTEGIYRIKVESGDFIPYEGTLAIEGGKKISRDIALSKVEVKETQGEVFGRVVDAKSLNPLTASIEIYDTLGNTVASLTTNAQGEYYVKLEEGFYKIKVEAPRYIKYEGSIAIEGGRKTTKDISLLKEKMVFTFRNIYFELNKADIKPESYPVLDSIALFLNEYPNVKIEIGGHTDSRGSDEYNLKLSQARAEAVRDYLIKVHNISPERLIAKGYGKTRLLIYPEKTEQEYQMNRRVEFTILGTLED